MKYFLITLMTGMMICLGVATGYGEEGEEEVYDYLLHLSIDELIDVPIQSSGLFAMNQEQAPGLNSMVTKEQLDVFGVRSLADYLNRWAPAFATVIHGTQGTTVGSRGVLIDNSSKTLLLRDNLNMNNRHFVGINGSELSSPLLGDVDRIEVATGPGVLQHGSGAINGFLNMVSATGESKEGVRMHTSYGSGDAGVVEGSYGRVIGAKANVFVYGGLDRSRGVKAYYPLSADKWAGLGGVNGTPSETFLDNVRVGKTDDDYKFSFRFQYGRETDPLQLDLKALRSHTSNVDPVLGEYLSPQASWAEEVRLAAEARGGRYSPFYEQQADNLLLSPELKLHLNSDNEITLTPFYQTIKTTSMFSDFLLDEVERLNISLAPKPGPADTCPNLNCEDSYSNGYGDEVHFGNTLTHTFRGLKDQTIAWGAEEKSFQFGDQGWGWMTVGLFAEDQLRLGKLTILPGLRYDKTYFSDNIATVPPFDEGPYSPSADVDALTKRLATSYQLDERQTVKLSYQEGFRFADAWLQQWGAHQAVGQTNQVDIVPEESTSYEADYAVHGLLARRLDLSLALFYNQYDHVQGWINDPALGPWGGFGNSPVMATSVGGDLIVEFRPTPAWHSGLSYSLARPLDSYETSIKLANQDDTWTRYPDQMIKFHLGHELLPGLFVGTVGVIESPRYTKAQVTDPEVAALFDKWSLVMDANAWYQIDKRLRVSFSAKEILHKNYNQYPAYFSGEHPLDAPRPAAPQYFLSLDYAL